MGKVGGRKWPPRRQHSQFASLADYIGEGKLPNWVMLMASEVESIVEKVAEALGGLSDLAQKKFVWVRDYMYHPTQIGSEYCSSAEDQVRRRSQSVGVPSQIG